jgi:ankyrin repeat protein
LQANTRYYWQVTFTSTKNTLINGPVWSISLLPEIFACCGGCLELVQLLIKAGADVNKFYTALITNDQNSVQNITSSEYALTLACENGHTDVVAVLIKAGAEADRATRS